MKKKYIDRSVNGDGDIVQVGHEVKTVKGQARYYPNFKDTRVRKMTMIERFKNWMIRKLGGKPKDFYSTYYVADFKKEFEVYRPADD